MLGGSFWGLLFGPLFAVPVLGVAVGAAVGAVKGSLSDVGIDDDFIESVRAQVTPGTSALFVMSSDAVLDEVKEAFARQDMELISTNLSSEQEQALLQAFHGVRSNARCGHAGRQRRRERLEWGVISSGSRVCSHRV